MRINSDSFKGTGKVYSFTLSQLIKSKGNIISIIIMLLFSLLSIPVSSLIMGGGEAEVDYDQISTIYYLNETDYEISFKELSDEEGLFKNSAVKEASFSAEDYKKHLNIGDAFVHVYFDNEDNLYRVQVLHREEAQDTYAFEELSAEVANLLGGARYRHLGASEQQLEILMTGLDISAGTLEDYQSSEDVDYGSVFAVQYGYSIIALILSMYSTVYIIRAIIEEKASKLVETLMVSINPLAMIAGKILAVMTYVFGMLLLMLGGFGLSYFVSGRLMDTSAVKDMIMGFGIKPELLNLSAMTIFVVLISLLLGYLTFSIIAGLAGTSCSTMEDVEAANMNVVIVVMFGYILSSVGAGFGGKTVLISSLIPVVSIFSAPVYYVLGEINLGVVIIAWILQLCVIALLYWFCGRVYHQLILHRGSKLKLKTMLSLARSKDVKEV